jgi:ATP/ADP translocase
MSSDTLQERIAGIFLVKPNESRVVVFNLVLFVFLGIGLALGRGTADALFFKRYGIEHLPWVYVLSALSLAVSCTLYAAFADRLSSERFFSYILGTLAVMLFMVWALMRLPGNDWLYPLYYVVYEIASELVLIHAGLYLNQNLNALQAKRLVPLIFGGSQVGVIFGGIMLATLSPLIGVSNILLIWMTVSLVSIVMLVMWHRQHGTSPFYKAARKRKVTVANSVNDVFQGLKFMKQSTLLRMASFALFFMVIMFYVLIYSVNQVYTETFKTEESLSAFFGVLVAINSSIALLLQFFVANRLLRKFGVRTVNLFFPFTSLLSYLMLLVSFTLPSALIGSFNKDVVMTAFRNPVWSLMMNALPANIQGRARAMTVAVVIPSALMVAGVLLLLIKDFGSPVYVAIIGLVSAGMYLHFSRHMNNVYVAEIISHLKQKLILPKDEADVALRGGSEVLQDLVRGIEHPDDQIYLAYSQSLIKSYPEQATQFIVSRLPDANNKVKDQIVRQLLPLEPALLPEILWQLIEDADERFQSTCYYSLIRLGDDRVRNMVPGFLLHPHARLRAVGVMGVYYLGIEDSKQDALQVWTDLLCSEDKLSNMFGLELLDISEDMHALPAISSEYLKHAASNLMSDGELKGCLVSLNVSKCLHTEDAEWFAEKLRFLSNHVHQKVRVASLYGWMKLDKTLARAGIESLLEDVHPQVRELAAKLMFQLKMDQQAEQSDVKFELIYGSPRAQSAMLEQWLAENRSSDQLVELALAKVDEVKQINEALQVTIQAVKQTDQSSLKVLSMLLEERLQATMDLTLQVLQSGEDADAIRAIRMGMQSHEVQYQATACEALQGLKNISVGRALATIIESPSSNKKRMFAGVDEVIAWCLGRQDPWLNQCAKAVQAG